jgi:hypothetical protein
MRGWGQREFKTTFEGIYIDEQKENMLYSSRRWVPMTLTLTDILSSIDSAFPIFSFGEGYIDEALNKFSFDQEGMKRRRDWYDRLSKNVLEFLDERFPELGQRGCSIICDLQLSLIREKITRVEDEFDYYRSLEAKCQEMVLRYTSQAELAHGDHSSAT